MPWPTDRYHAGPGAGAVPADFQIASSLVWVPDLSPRLAKVAAADWMLRKASFAVEAFADTRRVRGRTDDDEVVVHHVVAPHAHGLPS